MYKLVVYPDKTTHERRYPRRHTTTRRRTIDGTTATYGKRPRAKPQRPQTTDGRPPLQLPTKTTRQKLVAYCDIFPMLIFYHYCTIRKRGRESPRNERKILLMEKSDDKNGLVAAEVIDAEVIQASEGNVFTRNRSKVIAGILGVSIFIGGGIATAYYKPFARNQAVVSGTQIVEAPTIGKLTLPEGTYEGEIVGGKANGTGKITFIDDGKAAFRTGDYWVGGFTDNKWHGMGTITYYREGQPPNIKEFDVDQMREFVDPRNADVIIPEPAKVAPKVVTTPTTTVTPKTVAMTPTPATPKATPAVVTPAKTIGKLTLYRRGDVNYPGDYVGEIVDGKAEGQGEVHWLKPEGLNTGLLSWKGFFWHNAPSGKGTWTYTDKDGKVNSWDTDVEGIA